MCIFEGLAGVLCVIVWGCCDDPVMPYVGIWVVSWRSFSSKSSAPMYALYIIGQWVCCRVYVFTILKNLCCACV